MRIDFYQLTRDPPYRVLPAIAQNIMKLQEKLHVVSSADSLGLLSKALWTYRDDSFLAHSILGVEDDEEEQDNALQPILLSSQIDHSNEAQMLAICDGIWREEAKKFARTFFLFEPDKTDEARSLWRTLSAKDDTELHYWKQEGRKWIEGPSKAS